MGRVILLSLLIISLMGWPDSLNAQRPGDFIVTPATDGWNMVHKVSKGETVFMLARRYHVPPAILADANGVSYNEGLKEGGSVVIPLGAYNMQTEKPSNPNDSKALYYKVRPEDNLYRISRHTSVPQKTLARWNNLQDADVRPGQVILVGWVLYDATPVAGVNGIPVQPVTRSAQPVQRPAGQVVRVDTPKYVLQPPGAVTALPDTATQPAPAVPPIEALFKEQTLDGQNMVWEKGSAAFFSVNTKVTGVGVYAFHNKASRGSVIRVKNMNNGRVIFVKVLGPIPLTKQYYNCIIALSGRAKAALGVREAKAFCELSYAGY